MSQSDYCNIFQMGWGTNHHRFGETHGHHIIRNVFPVSGFPVVSEEHTFVPPHETAGHQVEGHRFCSVRVPTQRAMGGWLEVVNYEGRIFMDFYFLGGGEGGG